MILPLMAAVTRLAAAQYPYSYITIPDGTDAQADCIPASNVERSCVNTPRIVEGAQNFVSEEGVTGNYFTAKNVPYGTMSGPWQDGGVRAVGGFNCGGPGSLWYHGVPCLADHTGPLEITGWYDPEYDGEDIANVELTTPPNAPRKYGYIVTAMNGPTKMWWVRYDGATRQNGNILLNGTDARIQATGNIASHIGIEGNITPGSGSRAVYITNSNRLSTGDQIVEFYNNKPATLVGSVDYGGAYTSAADAPTEGADHHAAYQATGTAAFASAVGKSWDERGDCPAEHGGPGLLGYFTNVGWAACDSKGWHRIALQDDQRL